MTSQTILKKETRAVNAFEVLHHRQRGCHNQAAILPIPQSLSNDFDFGQHVPLIEDARLSKL
jgi:hypothetical protein